MKLNKETIIDAINNIRTAPEMKKIDPEETARFLKLAERVLEDYDAHFGEDAEFEYKLKKKFTCTELVITIPGNPYDPLLTEKHEIFDSSYKMVSSYLVDRISTAFFAYAVGRNIISIRAPRQINNETIRAQLPAVILGIICGLLARILPETISVFLIDGLISPVYSVLLTVMSGIMGPVLFFSLLKSVTMLKDISELNSLGRTVIHRFLISTMFIVGLSIMLCLMFFRNFGESGVVFLPDQIVQLILDMIPTNMVKPFVDGKIPQIIVLALGMGAALLMIGERGNRLKGLIGEGSVWLNAFVGIVGRVAPAITFLNLAMLVSSGKNDTIFGAWKYIVGVILCIMIYSIFKLCFVSFKHSLNPLMILRKLKPLIAKNFTAHSSTQTIDFQKQIARENLGVKESFVEFWVPMSFAMYYPYTAICGIVAAFCAAQMSGSSVSLSFLLVLFILAAQLSLSSSSVTSSMVIVFGQLGLPAGYIGLFNACGMFVRKIASVFSSIYTSMEELDAAFVENAVDETILHKNT